MTEGWATYAEGTLLLKNTNLYTNTLDKQVLLQKYGVIYYQVGAVVFEFGLENGLRFHELPFHKKSGFRSSNLPLPRGSFHLNDHTLGFHLQAQKL